MDFEFQNGTGPIDGRSPFAQVSQNTQRFPPASANKKRMLDEDIQMQDATRLTGMRVPGTYSAFDSPSKSKPSHHHHQPSSPSKPLPPAPPAFNALFTTPRKQQYTHDIDDSSAGETPRSPEQRDDSDAGQQTPDHNYTNYNSNSSVNPLRNALSKIDPATLPGAQERTSPTKEKERARERPGGMRRESWIGNQLAKAKNKWYSPGRGEVPRVDHTSKGMNENRIEKRRRREKVGRRRRHSMSEDYSEDDNTDRPRAISPRKTSGQQAPSAEGGGGGKEHWISSLWTFIERHPTVPHILSWYAQLFFNIFLLACFAYLLFSFWSAVQGDVDKHTHEAMADIMAEMAVCAREYTANRCERENRVPAMETVCENWRKCMERDPARVGRAKVSAHTFAEIFNSFLEPISWKAMIFTMMLVFGCFAISNFAL